MKYQYIKGKNILAFLVVQFCLVTLSAVSVIAQSPRTTSPVDRRIETINRQTEQYDRDSERRDLEGKNNNATDKKRAQQITAEVKEDFEHIQLVYNKLVITMSGKAPLDYKFVAEATSEVKKRASRLKTNLALPKPKEEDEDKNQKKEELTEEQIKPSLMTLRNHIYSFVTNPIFETSGVVDVELSTKARRDLNQIIKLSESIEKCADKFKKSE